MTGMMPDTELLMIPDAGHLPWLDDPVLTADLTREFLGRGSGARPADLGQITGAER